MKKNKDMKDSLVFRCERFRFKLVTQPPLDFLHTGPVNLSQHDFLSDEPDVPGLLHPPTPPPVLTGHASSCLAVCHLLHDTHHPHAGVMSHICLTPCQKGCLLVRKVRGLRDLLTCFS